MNIRTRPISNKEYVHLSLSELQDVLDGYDRAIAARARAIKAHEEIIDTAKADIARLDREDIEIESRTFEIEQSERIVARAEREIKRLEQLRESFLSSRAAEGEKFALVD